ncbi:MAG: caspase family protein, partial [Spirochaetia bacterium]|nr:caspase family protein [Spirochaetia bacterium]
MKRAVLCVGEDKYENLNPLSFAVEDAWRFRFFLSEIGFDIHHSLASPSNEDILKKMDDILAELDEGDLFVFYYAGHGIVFKNDYLLLDYQATDKESELEAGRHVIPLSYLKTRTGADKGIQRLFIFDSCRTELHGRSAVSKKSRGGRVIRNLVENKRIGGELSVVYSTAEGFPAEELPELEQGLFTKALLEEMKSRLHTALTFDSDLLKGVRSRMDAVRSQFGYDRSQKPALYVIDPITIYTGSPVVTPSHTNKGTQQKSMAQKKAGLTTSRKKKTPEKLGQKNKKPSGTGGGQGADVHFLPWVKFGISIFIVLLILSIAAALVIVTTDNLPYWYLKELPEWMLSEGQIVRREVGWL